MTCLEIISQVSIRGTIGLTSLIISFLLIIAIGVVIIFTLDSKKTSEEKSYAILNSKLLRTLYIILIAEIFVLGVIRAPFFTADSVSYAVTNNLCKVE